MAKDKVTDREALRKACILGNFHISKEDYDKLSEEDKESLVDIGRKLGYPICTEIEPKGKELSTESTPAVYV